MRSIKEGFAAAGELGLKQVLLLGIYELGLRSGLLRFRSPIYTWGARPFESWVRPDTPTSPEQYFQYRRRSKPNFTFGTDGDLSNALERGLAEKADALIEEAEGILRGQFRLFGSGPYALGFPPDWSQYPPGLGDLSGPSVDLSDHWTHYRIDSLPGDIKLLWEPSRMGWVFVLARAYRLSHDPKYAEGFWQLLTSWREANIPNAGPHWISAQEAALRILALTFGCYAFFPSFRNTPARLTQLAEMIAVHAARIPKTLSYARAQRNNHLITEAGALYTVGLLFPEFRDSRSWRKMGRRWFLAALRDQVFRDGGYIQHSVNYHRLALQAALWVAQLARYNHDPLPNWTLEALKRLTGCLSAFVQEESGRVSNYGSNDGSLILPLSMCPYHDYRPTLQSAWLAFNGRRRFASGPWDEMLLWLGLGRGSGEGNLQPPDHQEGIDPHEESGLSHLRLSARQEKEAVDAFPYAGLFFLRGPRSLGLLRCAHFTTRPAHSDQLHFDLWWRGENIARDPGTYLYAGKSPWDNGLSGAAVHNGALVDEAEPMERAGKFLWLKWAQGRVLGSWRSRSGILEAISAEHGGYDRIGVRVRRTVVRCGDDRWMIVDDAFGEGVHTLSVGWLLPDAPWEVKGSTLILRTSEGKAAVGISGSGVKTGVYRMGTQLAGVARVEEEKVAGWQSPTYALKEAALSYVALAEGPLPLRVVTTWELGERPPEQPEVEWAEPGRGPAGIKQISFADERLDL